MFNKLSKDDLKTLVQSMAWNDGFGCYTRAGLEKIIWKDVSGSVQACVFIDVDDMHELNERYGYDGVNELIKKSLVMRSTDYVAGQWFSGDEIIVLITRNSGRADPDTRKFCERLQGSFRENGVSITVGVSNVVSFDLMNVVKPAFDLVQSAKREGRRGTINFAPAPIGFATSPKAGRASDLGEERE